MSFGKTTALIIIFLFLSFSSALGQEKNSPNLYPVVVNGKWGYINRQLQMVVQPRFDFASDFMFGVASDVINGKFNYINIKGEIIPLQGNEHLVGCSEGICLFWKEKFNKVGFVREDGQIIVAPRFSNAHFFSEGLAGVCEGKQCGFIDRTGKWALPPKYQDAGKFVDGLANVVIDGQACFIDQKGKVVIKTDVSYVSPFSDGLAAFRKGGVTGFIDRTGKVVIAPQFKKVHSFKEGLAQIEVSEKCGYIDKTGKVVIEAKFRGCTDFSEGLARVSGEGDFWSLALIEGVNDYIDRHGNTVFRKSAYETGDFHGGIARVSFWVNPLYLEARDLFFSLRSKVTGKKIEYPPYSAIKVGYMDKTGNYVWPPQN